MKHVTDSFRFIPSDARHGANAAFEAAQAGTAHLSKCGAEVLNQMVVGIERLVEASIPEGVSVDVEGAVRQFPVSVRHEPVRHQKLG